MSDQPFRPKNRDRRVVTVLLLGLVLLFGGLYVAGYLFTSNKVARGTTVAGVDIGGLRPAAARRVLERGIASRANEPIVVSAGGLRTRIEPAAAGLRVDAAASVAQTGAGQTGGGQAGAGQAGGWRAAPGLLGTALADGGRDWRPASMWEFFVGGEDLDAVVTVDEAKLSAAIGSFAKQVDRPAKEGRVTISTGHATPHFPETGQVLVPDGSAAAVRAAYLDTSVDVVPLPVRQVDPQITDDEVHTAMNDFANPAMSAPVFIGLGGKDVVLSPAAYSGAISLRNRDGRLVPTLDAKALMEAIGPARRRVSLAPREAAVRLVGGRPKVIPARNGVTFRQDDITKRFLSLVVQHGRNRALKVRSVVDRPDFTTADARRLRIRQVVSSFTTNYPHAAYRNTNLGRAAELINGTVLKPGETFSLNKTVGERTRANGFTEGFIISDGVFKEDLGGGVSQVATTTFNAAFFAGLEDVEHKPHSFYIDRYPIGREATVAWGSVDLKFKNTTPYGLLIQAGIDPSTPSTDGAMTVRMWSTKHWDITTSVSGRYDLTSPDTRHLAGEACVPNDGYGGFDIDVFRVFHSPGKEAVLRRETMHTTYTPSDNVVCS